MPPKITLLAENCWVIRSPRYGTGPRGEGAEPKGWMFHEAANQWNGSPAHATIYRSEEVADRMVADMRYHKRAGFAPNDIVEVVPLEGALRTVGTVIEIN